MNTTYPPNQNGTDNNPDNGQIVIITKNFYPKPDNFLHVLTVVQMVYGLPSFCLLVFFFTFLCKYHNSFYRLVQMDLFASILCYLNSFVLIRFSHYEIGFVFSKNLENFIPGSLTVCNLLIRFFLNMQFCSAILLSSHRLTAFMLPTKYEMFWSRWYWIFGLICITYSIIPRLLVPGKVPNFWLENDTYYYISYPQNQKYNDYLNAASTIVYFVVLLITGMITSYLLKKRTYNANSSSQVAARKLTKIALTYCVLYLGTLLWTLLTAINTFFRFMDNYQFVNAYTVLNMVTDLMTFSLPYILMIFDRNVQRDLMGIRHTTGVVPFYQQSSTN